MPSSVVAIGAFDGVHRGHQRVISQAVKRSKKYNVPTVVYTFDPSPRSYFQGARILTTIEKKIEHIQRLGVDHVVIARFDETYINRTPASFIDELTNISPLEIHVGRDFRFGKNRSGDVDLLAEHFQLQLTESVCCPGGTIISSTRIRNLLSQGNIQEATFLLGWSSSNFVSQDFAYQSNPS